MSNVTIISQGVSLALAVLTVVSINAPKPVPPPETTTAATSELAEQEPTAEQNPVINSGSVSSQPAETEVNESPPAAETWLALSPVFTDYREAALAATSAREILVLIHPDGMDVEKSREALAKLPAALNYVWLFVPADSMVGQVTAQQHFGSDRNFRLIRHNVVTGANRIVYQPKDLEN